MRTDPTALYYPTFCRLLHEFMRALQDKNYSGCWYQAGAILRSPPCTTALLLQRSVPHDDSVHISRSTGKQVCPATCSEHEERSSGRVQLRHRLQTAKSPVLEGPR